MRNVRPKPPTITLQSLLKRRRTTLGNWMRDAGVSCYDEVVRWCGRIGALPPTEDEFRALMPSPVTAQTSGIVVVSVGPPPIPADALSSEEEPKQKKKARQQTASVPLAVTDRRE